MIMLSSVSLAYFSPYYSGALSMILCSSLTDTLNKNFGTNCGSDFPSMDNFRESLDIEDCKT